MTPDFIAVHEDWTVKEVLDYVRENGQDSETLNVIYVVDERGKLIDDLRIREFLLRPLTTQSAANSTDRNVRRAECHRFAAKTRLNVFRKYDRTALPVVDSSGVLVGIVTIDDMLDVAEEKRPKTSRSSAVWRRLDEPYMTHLAAADGEETRDLADHPVPRRNAHRHRHAGLQRRDREGRRARPCSCR